MTYFTVQCKVSFPQEKGKMYKAESSGHEMIQLSFTIMTQPQLTHFLLFVLLIHILPKIQFITFKIKGTIKT